MRQFHFFCKQRYLKYTVLSLLLCPLSSSAAEEWKDVKGESTTNIVESTQQKKQKRVITGVVRDSDTRVSMSLFNPILKYWTKLLLSDMVARKKKVLLGLSQR